MKTAADLAALTRQRTWDKDVVLWVGAEHALMHTLGQTPHTVLGLLARYHAGVREFYEWFCGDFAMVVLILDGLLDERVWPEEVACDADRLLTYFNEPGIVKQVFGEKG